MKKKIKFFILGFFLLFIFYACGGNKSEKGVKKDTLIVATTGVKILDPHLSNDIPSSRIFTQIYENLVAQDPDMKIVPALAEKWEQVDSTTTIFHLRKNVKFHNGEPLKASDVKFSIERGKSSPVVAVILEAIDRVEVVDDSTVKIVTKFPFAPLLNHLAHNAAAIISEKTFNELGDKFGQNPIGTGPYKFVEWKSGESVTLIANEDYYLGETPIKNLKFKIIVEGTNRLIGLETKELDIAYDMETLDSEKVKENKDLILLEKPSLSVTYLGFNTRKKPYDDIKVRQAIAYLVDRKAIVDTVFSGYAKVATSLISPDVFGYSPDGTQYERNVEKAKKLLAEAGYPDGFKASIWTNDNPVRVAIAVIMQDQLKAGGIDLKIETLEWGAFLDGTARGDHEMYMIGWVTATGDADNGLRALTSTETLGAAGNRAFYENPEVDRLLDDGIKEIAPEKRLPIYRELQIIINEELPVLPICYPMNPVGTQKNVKNFKVKPDLKHYLYGVSFE